MCYVEQGMSQVGRQLNFFFSHEGRQLIAVGSGCLFLSRQKNYIWPVSILLIAVNTCATCTSVRRGQDKRGETLAARTLYS